MRRLLAALALALWAAAAPAQVVTDADGLREIAARLLEGGEVARAGDLARALLARDPGDVGALVLLSRSALAAGDPRAALPPARRAHALAPRGPARFAAARLAARAHADLGQDTRAQAWLRRSLADAPDQAAAVAVARDYRFLRARNPLAFSLSFGAAPSSNINGGSASETIVLPGIPFEFVLDGEARALSGLRLAAGGTLSYRLGRGERSATFLEAQASGRTYVLSPDARDQAPEARGSDYADVAAALTLAHRWRGATDGGPSGVSATLGQSWYDGRPYLRFGQVGYERVFTPTARDRVDFVPFVERTDQLDDGESYWTLGARAWWTRTLGSGDRATLSLGLRDTRTALADVGYDGALLGAGLEPRARVLGLRLGLAAAVDWRDYDASDYADDGRRDVRGTLRVTTGLPRLAAWGFEPTVTLEASRTWSDVDLFDRNALSLELGVRSRL